MAAHYEIGKVLAGKSYQRENVKKLLLKIESLGRLTELVMML